MRVFELFSGIGGMHCALKRSEGNFEVIAALDINPTANIMYMANFPKTTLLEKNVQSVTSDLINSLNIELLTMSPPCQPFTRQGLFKDLDDPRCDALLHIIKILPQLKTVNYILLENVVGFEKSEARTRILSVLDNFECREFLLSPTQLGIPNFRRRYYLLCKRKPREFNFDQDNLVEELPSCYKVFQNFKICDILEKTNIKIPLKVLVRYSNIFDIVFKDSQQSCCFTKGYTHYFEGTGSVYCPYSPEKVREVFEFVKNNGNTDKLEELDLRFFTPREVARLLCFPDDFIFPSNLSEKQIYRVLGNSINVHIVAVLIKILLD